MSRMRILGIAAILPALAGNGCIVIGVGWNGPSIWTESRTERLELDTANLSAIEVRTHNGSIAFSAVPVAEGAYVDVTKKGRGLTPEDAENALDAIDVYVESAGAGVQRVGWRWRGVKAPTWRARVSFDIRGPGDLDFKANTHNGPIKVGGVAGDVNVVAHNGRINVESSAGKLYAQTHNGGISAVYAGDEVTLVTHNGRIVADLTGCGVVNGSITTHNGSVEVSVGDSTSARLTCRTHNGGFRISVPLNESEISRRRLTGTIGTGEGRLSLTTHNGSVRIKKAS